MTMVVQFEIYSMHTGRSMHRFRRKIASSKGRLTRTCVADSQRPVSILVLGWVLELRQERLGAGGADSATPSGPSPRRRLPESELDPRVDEHGTESALPGPPYHCDDVCLGAGLHARCSFALLAVSLPHPAATPTNLS